MHFGRGGEEVDLGLNRFQPCAWNHTEGETPFLPTICGAHENSTTLATSIISHYNGLHSTISI